MLMTGRRNKFVETVMSRTALVLSIAAAALALPAVPAAAAITVYNAQLSGAEEVPFNASPGTGFVIVTIDDVLATMRVQATFADLIGITTASHIHCCAGPGNTASIATTTPSFTGFPLGVTAGTYDNTFDMTLTSSFRAGFITENGGTTASAFAYFLAGLDAGNAYFNIHTLQSPGGEIRGQLAAVPEPSTWMLMIGGFGLLGAALRRRRQAKVLAF
jgi:hypothetical protein